jgi:tetrahydromethanopterin S-methyltransferase subunit G
MIGKRLETVEEKLEVSSSEIGLLVVLIVVSTYMLITSLTYQAAVRRFPLLTASGTLIGATVLLFRGFLPAAMKDYVTQSEELMHTDSDHIQVDEQGSESNIEFSTAKVYKTMGFIIAYGIIGYLIGLLYATPLFVAAHTIWTRQPWYTIISLTVLSYAIGYAFVITLYVPLNEGALTGWIF